MDEALLTDLRFHQLLLGFDQDLARSACTQGCRYCRGVLHSARYWRKPRGFPVGLGDEYRQRFSFCCAVKECRKRKTPTSLRFLGPKVYGAAIIVLVSVMRDGTVYFGTDKLPADQLTGKVKEQWGKLTDDDLDRIAGKRDQLAGRIQEAYGIEKDEVEKQIHEFEKRQKDQF